MLFFLCYTVVILTAICLRLFPHVQRFEDETQEELDELQDQLADAQGQVADLQRQLKQAQSQAAVAAAAPAAAGWVARCASSASHVHSALCGRFLTFLIHTSRPCASPLPWPIATTHNKPT